VLPAGFSLPRQLAWINLYRAIGMPVNPLPMPVLSRSSSYFKVFEYQNFCIVF